MGILKARFIGTVDQDANPKPIDKRTSEKPNAWVGRIAQVTGKFYVGSLMLDAIDPITGAYPQEIDPPIPNLDYFEMHEVAVILSLENGADTPLSMSIANLKAGDTVSFPCNVSFDTGERGWLANARPTEAIAVLKHAEATNNRRSRLEQLGKPQGK